MAIKDRNGALHSEKNGQFVSNGEGESSGFDVEKLSKEPRGHLSSVVPGKNEPPTHDISNDADNLPGLKKTVNPGKESKTSKAYGNRITTEFGIKNVDISRVDPACANDVYDGLKKCFSDFPMLKGYIKGLRYDPDVHELAQWYPTTYQIILGCAYANADALKNLYNRRVSDGLFPFDTTHNMVVAHEFGHAINTYLSSDDNNFAQDAKEEICQYFGLDEKLVEKRICKLAGENSSEFVAVLFHKHMQNKTDPDDITKKFKLILRRTIKNANRLR